MMQEDLVPVGCISAFAGPSQNIPLNWMVCDGRKINKNDYIELFNRIGTSWGGDGAPFFFLPDLRGQFLRGVDKSQDGTITNIAKDPDRDLRIATEPEGNPKNSGNRGNAVGSFQGYATSKPLKEFIYSKPGNHHHGDPTYNGQSGPYEMATSHRGTGGYDYGPQSAPTTDDGDHTHRIVSGGDNETRPINAYVYFIIRAK